MANNTNWLNISSQSGSSGQTILTLSANKNLSTNYKTAEITAYNPVYNVSAKTYVTIESYAPYIEISPTLIPVADSGGTFELSISANCSWVIAYPDLVSSYSTTAGTGDTTITFSVPSTTADTTLVGNIVVTDESGQMSRTARIEQYGSGAHIGIFPVELYFDSTGGSKTFSITADCAYNVSMSSGGTWASVTPNSGYTGQTTFTVTVDSGYTGDTQRSTAVLIDAPGIGGLVAVYQKKPETRLIVGYYVTSTTEPTVIMNTNGLSAVSLAEYPDGTQITPATAYTFPATGMQYVYYTLTGDTVPQSMFDAWGDHKALSGTVKTVIIPNGITGVGTYAFYGLSGLTSVTLPDTLEVLSSNCFYYCAFSSITLPDSLSSIGTTCFANCSYLSSITIPSGVTNIGSNCFTGSSVSSITFTSLTPPTLGNDNALSSSSLSEIIVPCPAVYDYITAWPQYAQYISCNDTGTTLYFVTDTSNVKGIGETRTITILNTNINPNRTGLELPGAFPQQGAYTVDGNVIYLTYPKNPSSSSTRTWTIGVVAQTKDGVSLKGAYRITQNANALYSIPYTADTSTINKTGETRTIEIDASNLVESSITIGVEGAGGIETVYNDGIITIVFPPNSSSAKDITVNVYGVTNSGNDASATINYRQNGEIETRLVCIYNVTSTTAYTTIRNTSGTSPFPKIELADGTQISSGSTKVKFPATGMQEVYFTLSGNNVPSGAFRNVAALKEVKIPAGIKGIDTSAFNGCSSLSSVTMEDDLETISAWAFSGCKDLTTLSLSTGLTNLDSYALTNFGITSLVLPDSLTGMGTDCVSACTALTSVVFGSGLTGIPAYSFSGDTALKSLTIPDSVTSVAYLAFSNCPSLSSITFGTGITQIGNIITNVSSMTGITFNGHTPPTLGSTALGPTGASFPIFVPCPAFSAYTAASSWENYKNRLQCFEEPIIPIRTGATVDITYDVTDISQPTKIINIYKGFDYAEGVGETLPDIRFDYRLPSGYTFPTTGVHTIRYYLTEPVVPASAWSGCSTVTAVSIGSGVTRLNAACFLKTSLTEITIPPSVTTINGGLSSTNPTPITSGCPRIIINSNAYMSSSGGGWGGKVFKDFLYVREVIIGNDVTFIGPYSFTDYPYAHNPWVEKIEIPNSVTGLGENAFYEYSNNYYGLSITLPDSIVEIGADCFRCAESINSVILPSGITYLPNRCFSDCMHLKGIEIPDSVTGIGAQCFKMKDCDENQQPISADLRTVIIGSGVTEIGGEAFGYCHRLTRIVAKPMTGPTITSTSFIGVTGRPIFYSYPGADYSNWFISTGYYPGYYTWTKKNIDEIPTDFLAAASTSVSSITMNSSGGTKYLSSYFYFLASNTNWTLEKSSGADWFRVVPNYSSGKVGYFPISLLADPNTTGQERTATLTLSNDSVTKTLTVTQNG